MPKIGLGVSQFNVFEGPNNFLGMASISLPDINWLHETISGSGIGGSIGVVYPGQLEEMTMSISFKTADEGFARLMSPVAHTIEIRADQLAENPATGEQEHQLVKHVLRVKPTANKYGTIAPASPTDSSCDFTVGYWKTVIDGQVIQELDPINMICIVNGVDYMQKIRKNLGK